MNSANIGTLRTFTPAIWASFLVWVATKIGISVTLDNALIITPPIVLVFYRLGRVLEAKWPTLGWVLFGYGTPPTYPHT